MNRHESRGAIPRKPALGVDSVYNHNVGDEGYVANGQFWWFSFRDETNMRYGVHVHVTGLSLNTAQEFLDKNYRGKRVEAIRSCNPPLDSEGDVGCVILVKTSI